jgi:REP element-mobilizing transposase RayT
MAKYENKYRIESFRLRSWDYSTPWWYYVTVNTKNHFEYFGQISNSKVLLNEFGLVTKNCWEDIPKHFPIIELDYFIIMPNHLHGIIIINDPGRDVACNVSTENKINQFSKISPKPNSLSVIIRSFKSAVAKNIHESGYLSFQWQPRFYDHIIHNGKELYNIRKYIEQNPLKWDIEKNNPENIFPF